MRVYYFIFMLMGAITAVDMKKEQKERVFGFLQKGCGGGVFKTYGFVCSLACVVLCVHGGI